MEHSFSSRVTVAPDVLFRIVGEETVLLNLKTEMYVGLDAVGTRMWNLLTQAPSIQAAYEDLLQEYEVDPPRLRGDLNDFPEKLLGHGLIDVGPQDYARGGASR